MKGKKTRVRIGSTAQYIQLLNGIFYLTDMEIRILAMFIDTHKKVTDAGLDINAFSTEMKKKVAERLGRENFNTLNNYIKSMHDKKAIVKTSEGYDVQNLLIPDSDEFITFKLEWITRS
jgi:hypothetical protein